jgi:hypothetical protein
MNQAEPIIQELHQEAKRITCDVRKQKNLMQGFHQKLIFGNSVKNVRRTPKGTKILWEALGIVRNTQASLFKQKFLLILTKVYFIYLTFLMVVYFGVREKSVYFKQ